MPLNYAVVQTVKTGRLRQVLQALKQDPITRRIPVIVLSGLSQSNELTLVRDGAAVYLQKATLTTESGSIALVQAIEGVLRQPH